MSLQFLVDMNLSPQWTIALMAAGYPSVHWSEVGDPQATDETIMRWAEEHEQVVFTHDFDFATSLALTHKSGPSVLQVRYTDVLPDGIEELVIAAVRQHEKDLNSGALVIVDVGRNRVRILPI